MQVIIKASGERCPDSGNLLEVSNAGAHDTLQSPEVLEELAALRRTQPRDDFQHRFVVTPRAFAAVAGDREPMRLVADALH